MRGFIRLADRLAVALMVCASVLTVVLVGAMLYEVVARYVFDAPTLWAFDISYMLNGSLFLLGAAYALKVDAHVRIDFVYQRFPERVRRRVDQVMDLAVLLPLFATIAWIAAGKAYHAWTSGEVEAVSPWAPLVWPFYAVIALGLAAFALQLLAEGLRRQFEDLCHPREEEKPHA